MIHYTCDRCKQVIDPAQDQRYIVRMEIQPALDPVDSLDSEDDRDHLMEVDDLLVQLEDHENVDDLIPQFKSFDLCQDCYRRFVKNPVGGEITAQLGFSNN